MTVSEGAGTLAMVYTDTGEPCDCLCSFDLTYTLTEVPSGSYSVTAAGGVSDTVDIPEVGVGPTSLILGGYAVGVLFAAATLVHVYQGGTTANDHFVAVVVTGTHLLFPTLWWGAVSAGALGLRGWGALFLVGSALVWSLFWLMDRRAEATGPLRLLGWLSQPAHAFALWSGLLLVFWAPLVLLLHWLGVAWLHPLWPGPLLLGPLGLAVWGTLHTHTHGTRPQVLGWPGAPSPPPAEAAHRVLGGQCARVELVLAHGPPGRGRPDRSGFSAG